MTAHARPPTRTAAQWQADLDRLRGELARCVLPHRRGMLWREMAYVARRLAARRGGHIERRD